MMKKVRAMLDVLDKQVTIAMVRLSETLPGLVVLILLIICICIVLSPFIFLNSFMQWASERLGVQKALLAAHACVTDEK